jgi:hypothetical protein
MATSASDFSRITREYGAYLIEDAARLSTAEALAQPHLVPTIVDNLRISLDAIENGLAAYEASQIAKVEADEHQLDIEDGIRRFEQRQGAV